MANRIVTVDENHKFPASVEARLSAAYATTDLPVEEWAIFGDSLSTGWQSILANDYLGLPGKVMPVGVGGQTSKQIAARQGGVPALMTVAGNTIPASGGVTVTAYTTNPVSGASITPKPGKLAGVQGVLTFSGGTLTFTRDAAGSAVACPANTPFVSDESVLYDDRHQIIWAGRNNFLLDGPQAVVSDLQAMRDRLAPRVKRAMVLSIPPQVGEENGTPNRAILDATNAAIEAGMPAEYVAAAEHLRSPAGMVSAGLQFTSADYTDISNGLTPTSLRTDTLHINTAGQNAISWKVWQTSIKRGWRPGTVVPDLHDPGVAGATHRYVPSLTKVAVGGALNSLYDLAGTHLLTSPGAGGRTLRDSGGVRYLENVTGGSVNSKLEAAGGTILSGPMTVAVVVKTPNANASVLGVGPYRIYRSGGGHWGISDNGAATLIQTATSDANWHLIVATLDGAATAWNLDGVLWGAGTLTGTGTPALTSIGGGATDAHIAEVVIWPTAFNATQRAAVRTAMKAKYPVLT